MPSRKQTFATALQRARHGARLTQVQLAHELETDPGTISRWERGEVPPRKSAWPRLLKRFPELGRFYPKQAAA